MRRRLLHILVGFVLLEVVLQIASFVAYLSLSDAVPPLAVRDGATVLCVGDSFTYGLGTTDREHAYPAALQRELGTRGIECSVVNAGWPSQNSRELLLGLKDQLIEHEPDIVLALIGLNDTWSRPALATVTEVEAAAPMRRWRPIWRTRRLAQWLLAGTGGCVATASAGTAVLQADAAQQAYSRGLSLLAQRKAAEAVVVMKDGLALGPSNPEEFHKVLV